MKLEWHAEEVIRAVRGHCLHEQSWIATGVAIDSRSIQKDDLFIALKGPTHDAHEFIAQAFQNGAVAAIAHRSPTQVPSSAPVILVDDTFSALQDLGRVGRQRSSAKIVAVTGSVGKTSSKEQLKLMFGAVGEVYANEGSFNNHWGVPLSLARLPSNVNWGVFELGMNHPGEITPLAKEVKPQVCLITNIESVHLEYFESTNQIAEAKAEIFLGMDADGTAVLNRDNPHYARLLAAARTQGLRRILGFGRDSKAEARMIDCVTDEDGSTVTADILGHKLQYRIATPGEHIAFNSLGTLLTAAAAGADIVICAEALATYRPLPGRGIRRDATTSNGGKITLIDETYNASPIAVAAAIKVLAGTVVKKGGRRIAALGDMRELGPTAPQLHAGLAKALVEGKIDRVYCCYEMMKNLYDALPSGMRGGYAADSAELAKIVSAEVQENDVILIKGSKSTHMEIIVQALEANNQPQKLAS
ncbi:MAG: UDP-N-acetylmuramoylalanyl-D-glutamyl-2,6-diaminopimelate--D-alanyl-D-alanine ligase [Alphaproteobacteria bacterium]|nr:UDP-N-acetylmuramoylalanyl-D-glutamyl-2,6-diaminopimelate--D-alanyl-D-alanine ligase [Alphaproteobacteria bacterium]